MSQSQIDGVVDELEGMIWEAENADFFSISDLQPLADRLKKLKWPKEYVPPTVSQKIKEYKTKDWLMLILAWFLVPLIFIALPFGWLYSKLFQA